NTGTITAGTGYTRLPTSAGNNNVIYLEQSSAASVAGTRGDYTSTIARRGCGCLVSYKAAGSGSGTGGSAVAPKRVQSTEKGFINAASGSVTLSQKVTTGNLLTVQIVEADANASFRTASVSDNLGNVYVKAARQIGSSASGSNAVEEWYARNATGG